MNAALPAILLALGFWLLLSDSQQRLTRTASDPRKLDRYLFSRPGCLPTKRRLLLGAIAGLMVAVAVDGLLGVAYGATTMLLVVWLLGFWVPTSKTKQLDYELPEALDFLAVCLGAGLPMSQAVDTVAEVSPEATAHLLAQVARHLKLGRAGPLAWQEVSSHQIWGPVARDIARSERSGISVVNVLRMHAADARQIQRDVASKRARSIGVKSAVPLMVCFLPAFVLVGVVPIVASLLGQFFG